MGAAGPVEISIPELCIRDIEGRDVAVKCGTNQKYEEPTDLEKYAREHVIVH